MKKQALVVGGTRRVGRWVSEALLASDWSVLALYRSAAEEALRLEAELKAAGLPFSALQADASDPAALPPLLKQHCSGGQLRLLVNAAGPAARGPLSETSAAQLQQLWQGNVLSVHNAVQAALPHLTPPAAVISFISAGNDSLRAYREVPAYGACKSMLLSYSRSLARELAPRGISVNCIALGVTELPPEGVPPLDSSALPTGRYVGQEELSQAIWYLSSATDTQLTGSVLNLTGAFAL